MDSSFSTNWTNVVFQASFQMFSFLSTRAKYRSKWSEIVSDSGFDRIFLMIESIEHGSVYLLTCLEKCSFEYLGYF